MNSDLQEYKEKTKLSGENLVINIFPKRVFELEELLKNVSSGQYQIDTGIYSDISNKALNVPVNPHLKNIMETMKPVITRLMEEALQVRMWIQFSIPKIEDGNNFGVGVQEEALSEAASIERDACSFLEQMSRYHVARARVLTKVQKFPLIQDYVACIIDLDKKQEASLRYIIMELRNHYAILHDIIQKNLDKIKIPRTNNSINMY